MAEKCRIPGKTSPEELLAAAHASCFSTALAGGLAKSGTPPERLEVTATVTFDKVADLWTVRRRIVPVSRSVTTPR